MTMSATDFETTFARLVEPVLFGLGFREVRPPVGWMAPAKLYEFENKWFGASWDWRDQYLEVRLGRLFRFRDVGPRAIVRGHYHHDADCTDESTEDFLTKHLMRVGQDVPMALEEFDERLAAAHEAEQTLPEGATKKDRRLFAECAVRLGGPIALEDWIGSRVIRREPA